MNSFTELGFGRMDQTPLPQMLPPSYEVWDSQETVEQAILPNGYDSSSSFEQGLQCDTLGSHSSSNTSYSLPNNPGSGNINPRHIQYGSPSEPQYQAYWPNMSPVASPDQFPTATPSPASFLHQSGSPTQATGHAISQRSGYFGPNYRQYSIRQEHQVTYAPQGQELYPNPNMGDPALPLPYHPTHHDEEEGTVADYTSPERYGCPCGAEFGRQTDLERHLRTARKHRDPSGPACPERGCKFTENFTRTDNFKVHYMRHGKSDKEADEFIKEWRALVN